MKKILFGMAAAVMIVTGCMNSSSKKAFDFNNKLTEISKANHEKWQGISAEIQVASQSHDFTKLTTLTNDLVAFLGQKITEVTAMENTGGSEDIKAAMLDFLNFDKKIADENVMPYTKITPQTTDEEIQAITQNLVQVAKQEDPFFSKLQAAQKEYAKKNGFKIEEK
jgi:tagatose-1,6-bisphosphate aldolase